MAFVVFEGLDGAGKSTLMGLVEKEVQNRGLSFCKTQDPGSTSLGQILRNIILDSQSEAPVAKAELLMYQAARVQMVEKVMRPALAKGQWILADRFYSSTVAFQSQARGLSPQVIDYLNEFVAENCHPDLFVFLDITVEESLLRKRARAKSEGVEQDRIERESNDFQSQVREGYLQQAEAQPEKWLVLDGTKKPQELCQQVISEFKKRSWLD